VRLSPTPFQIGTWPAASEYYLLRLLLTENGSTGIARAFRRVIVRKIALRKAIGFMKLMVLDTNFLQAQNIWRLLLHPTP
jgi:hypothetical protein